MDGLFSILAALIIFICLLKGAHANYKDKVAKGLIPKDEDTETGGCGTYACRSNGDYPSVSADKEGVESYACGLLRRRMRDDWWPT